MSILEPPVSIGGVKVISRDVGDIVGVIIVAGASGKLGIVLIFDVKGDEEPFEFTTFT